MFVFGVESYMTSFPSLRNTQTTLVKEITNSGVEVVGPYQEADAFSPDVRESER